MFTYKSAPEPTRNALGAVEACESTSFNLVDLTIAAIPIYVGACIYLLFRSQSILIFQIADMVGLGADVEFVRLLARPLNSYVHGFVLFSLPTALWAFSFIFCVVTVWQHQLKSLGAILIIVPVGNQTRTYR